MTQDWASLGIDVRGKTSGEVKAVCPWCSADRKKAHDLCLSVNLDTGLFHCHHCGEAGSLRRAEGPRSAPSRPAYTKPAYEPEPGGLDAAAQSWLVGRGISADVWERNRIGSDKGAITYPYFRGGEVVNVKHRGRGKKFWMVAGAELLPYGLDDITPGAPLVWVEGEMDKLAVEVAGITACVSVPNGAPSPGSKDTTQHFAYLDAAQAQLATASRHVIAVDNDDAGRGLADELIRRLGRDRCWRVVWPDCKDANDLLLRDGAAAVADAIATARPVPVAGLFEVEDFRDAYLDLYEHGMDGGAHPGCAALAPYYRVKPGSWTLLTGIPSHGKALSLDTSLPTPNGWTTMGQVWPGDRLLDERGQPCTVLAATPVMVDRECFRVTFSDGSVVICDAEHQWLTRDERARLSARNARKNGRDRRADLQPRGTDQSHLRRHPAVRTTREIAATLTTAGEKRLNHAVAVAAPLDLPPRDLPIPPYALGAWLGDGTTSDGMITTGDPEIVEEFRLLGYRVTERSHSISHGILGLKVQLRSIDLLGNKHIPDCYLRASIDQRRALLQGLMDTDGSVTSYGRCEFTNVNQQLARQVFELVASLGYQPTWSEGRATIGGRDCGPKYRVMFTPHGQIFRLARKQRFVHADPAPRLRHRAIVSCEPVPSVPVRCVQVDSPSHLYLCGRAMIPTHNSSFLDWLLMNLARKAKWQIAIFSPENQPIQRHIANLSQILVGQPFDTKRPGAMDRETAEDAFNALQENFTFILPPEDAGWGIDTILGLARAAVYRRGIRGLVIDPWNELEHLRPPGVTETEHVSTVLTQIRRFAREHGVHVWLVAHPTKLQKDKDGEYPVPTPYDISGSAHFRNKADMALCVWRDINDAAQPTQIHIQKVRFRESGELGMVPLFFDIHSGRYSEYPIERRYQPAAD